MLTKFSTVPPTELVEEGPSGRGMDSAHLPFHRRDGALPERSARQRDRRVQAVQEDRDQGKCLPAHGCLAGFVKCKKDPYDQDPGMGRN